MPFRSYSPGATIFSFLAMGVLSLFKGKKKNSGRKRYVAPITSPKPLTIPEHPGLTCETYEISILNIDFAKRTFALPVGTELSLSLEGIHVSLNILGEKLPVGTPLGSPIKTILAEGKPYHVYIKAREFERYTLYDFFTIAIYY